MVKEKIAENIILLSFDYKFKKMFGDNDAIDRLEVIISIIFDLPVEDIKGKISILNGEKLVESENEKKGRMDVYLRLQLKTGYERIDTQVSDRKLSQSIIDRNLLYGAHKSEFKSVEKVGNELYEAENHNREVMRVKNLFFILFLY